MDKSKWGLSLHYSLTSYNIIVRKDIDGGCSNGGTSIYPYNIIRKVFILVIIKICSHFILLKNLLMVCLLQNIY